MAQYFKWLATYSLLLSYNLHFHICRSSNSAAGAAAISIFHSKQSINVPQFSAQPQHQSKHQPQDHSQLIQPFQNLNKKLERKKIKALFSFNYKCVTEKTDKNEHLYLLQQPNTLCKLMHVPSRDQDDYDRDQQHDQQH